MATKETQETDLENQAGIYTGRRTSTVAVARGGEEVQVVLQQRKQPAMHDIVDVDGTLYDIPKEDEGLSVDGFNNNQFSGAFF